jgi:hypothetical protein
MRGRIGSGRCAASAGRACSASGLAYRFARAHARVEHRERRETRLEIGEPALDPARERAAEVVAPLLRDARQARGRVERHVDEIPVRVEHRPADDEAELAEDAAVGIVMLRTHPRQHREVEPSPRAVLVDERLDAAPVRVDGGRLAARPADGPPFHVGDPAPDPGPAEEHGACGRDRTAVAPEHEMARALRAPARVDPARRLVVRRVRESGDELVPHARRDRVDVDGPARPGGVRERRLGDHRDGSTAVRKRGRAGRRRRRREKRPTLRA